MTLAQLNDYLERVIEDIKNVSDRLLLNKNRLIWPDLRRELIWLKAEKRKTKRKIEKLNNKQNAA